jgi:argininosuccinate lyase
MARMLDHTTFHRERMLAEAGRGFTTATDLAEYLVLRGLPFRLAHEIVGRIVRHCLDKGITLTQLTLAELQLFSPEFAEDVFACLDVAGSVNRKKTIGGTAADQVSRRLAELEGKS